MKGHRFYRRMGYALAGWRAGFRRESSFRTHVAIAAAVLVALVVLRPAPVWWAIVALLMTLVLALELVNAAIEAIIDRLHPDLHDDMRDAKDMASGAVLLMAVAAIVVAGALAVEMGWR